MKRFISLILLVLCLPICTMLLLFTIADPFKTIYPFDINDTNATNREYQSTELLLRNAKQGIEYDSFIFCSSKGANMSVEQWASHLGGTPHPFLFQSWSETLTGIELKVKYLDDNGYNIKNALVMFDYPNAFGQEQLPHRTLAMKHFIFTSHSRLLYNAEHFINFMITPNKWYSVLKKAFTHKNVHLSADSINNGMCPYFSTVPEADSLSKCTVFEKEQLLSQLSCLSVDDVVFDEPCISECQQIQLQNIKNIFDKQNTKYKVIICPEFCLLHPVISDRDVSIIHDVFGKEKVYNYSGINDYTTDIYMYSDEDHFGKIIGYSIIEEIYAE